MSRAPAAVARLGIATGIASIATGCAGASPLLHPAHVLAAGEVRALAGMSAQAATGALGSDLSTARDRATRDPTLPGASGQNADYARGAMVAAAVAPGVSPVVGARVGFSGRNEGGVTYTGRGARIDARHAWSDKHTALSAGIALDGAFLGNTTSSGLPGVDLAALRAFGIDVPVLVGWRSDASLYQVWAGLRGAYHRVTIAPVSTEPVPAATANTLGADHLLAGAVVGLAIGLAHIHVGLELDASYQWIRGSFNGTDASTSGVVLSPATALSWEF